MKAKHFIPTATVVALGCTLALPLAANEALDILEGKKEADAAAAPVAADGSDPMAEIFGEEGGEAPTGPVTYTPAEWAPSPLDPIWSRAVLFEDESNPWVQQLAIMGMFHFNGSWGTADIERTPDVSLDATRTRRARLGARLRAFGNTEIEAVGEFAGDGDYSRLERLKATTRVLPNHSVSFGKMRPRFGIEGSKDPQMLLAPERALLSSMLMPAESLGVMFSQDCDAWDWGLGWFSNDSDRYVPGLEGNGMIAANLAYESAERLDGGGAMRTRWTLDYLYNMDHRKSEIVPRYDLRSRISANGGQVITANPAFRHLVSTGIELEGDCFAFEGEFMLANGEVNAWGLTLTPSFWVVPGTLKAVARYHYADTDDPAGLVGGLGVSSDPFFDGSPTFVGDEFHSFYLGANLHLYQDKVVLLNGMEYALMKDDAGLGFETNAWIWHTGARVSF